MTPTDRAVIARVLEGDVDAYGILVDRYQGRFARFATRMLGSREDAEEAMQDAFLRAYQALGRYHDRERFDSWLYRILVNRCRSILAKRRRRVSLDRAIAEDPAPPPDTELVERDHATSLVRELPEEQREVFLLRFVDDLSYEAIAAITGVGVSALRMRVKRGLERLRQLLPEEPGDG